MQVQAPLTTPFHKPMPNHTNTPSNQPVTHPKNATTHPGTDAQKVLSIHHDHEVIDKEKVGWNAKKKAREHQKADEALRKETGQCCIEQLQAQLAIEITEEEAEAHQQLMG